MNSVTTSTTAVATQTDEQALFEAALRAKYGVPDDVPYPKRADGSYQSRSLNQVFEGWQLARAAQVAS